MIVVIQRVSEATVHIQNHLKGSIAQGFMILLGIREDDSVEDIQWLCKKIVNLRVFADEAGKMNHSLLDIQGEVLLISQFTLYASTKKGNRPSFIEAARPDTAIPLYEQFIQQLEANLMRPVQTGEFGADMQVRLCNDGPVTIMIDSKNRK